MAVNASSGFCLSKEKKVSPNEDKLPLVGAHYFRAPFFSRAVCSIFFLASGGFVGA